MSWVMAVGTCGSLLIALSLSMTNIWRLRWINLAGATTFATYGLLIGAWPVLILNSCIAVIDVVHLVRLTRRRDAFSFFAVPANGTFLREFLRFHRDDIAAFFPGFDLDRCRSPQIRLILRNMLPVGVFVCEAGSDGQARICLDYVVPGYRDLRTARFVYSADHDELTAAGLHTFVAVTEVAAHERYLKKVGFVRDATDPTRFTRPV